MHETKRGACGWLVQSLWALSQLTHAAAWKEGGREKTHTQWPNLQSRLESIPLSVTYTGELDGKPGQDAQVLE